MQSKRQEVLYLVYAAQ